MNTDRRQELEQLFHRHVKGVSSFLLARVGDPELAEEISARVFLKVVRNYHQLRGPVAPWLWTIVRNELARHFRDRKCAESLPPTLHDTQALPEQELERRQTLEQLGSAIDQLPEESQQLLYMKFFVEMTQRQMAEATGLTESNVGVRIYRALQRLRSLMEPRESFPLLHLGEMTHE